MDAHDARVQFEGHFCKHDPVNQWERLQQFIHTAGMGIGSTPLKSSPQPIFMDHADRSTLAAATAEMNSVLQTVAYLIRSRADVGSFLGFDKTRHSFLFSDPGYTDPFPVVRYDALFDPIQKRLQFLEFNTHSPSSIGWHDLLAFFVNQMKTICALKKIFTLHVDQLSDGLAAALEICYDQYSQKKAIPVSNAPFTVVMAGKTSAVRNDAEQLAALLQDRGMHCEFAYPQQLAEYNGWLALNRRKVDIVYRDAIQDFAVPLFGVPDQLRYVAQYLVKCLLTRRFCRLKNIKRIVNGHVYVKAAEVADACCRASVCMVNPVFSFTLSSKIVLALLHNQRFRKSFTEDQQQAIQKYVPWTHVLKPAKVQYRKDHVDLVKFVRANKDRFVIKPALGYGGYGVIIGRRTTKIAWARKVANAMGPHRLDVVQEFVDIPETQIPEFNGSLMTGYKTYKINLNLWSMGGRFSGSFIRASKGSVINLHAGGMLLPVFYVRTPMIAD